MALFETFRNRMFGNQSKTTAKNRLQMVLTQDRSGLSSQEMDGFRQELLDVLSKYFTIEKGSLDIEWHRSDNETALIINSPVTGRLKNTARKAAVA